MQLILLKRARALYRNSLCDGKRVLFGLIWVGSTRDKEYVMAYSFRKRTGHDCWVIANNSAKSEIRKFFYFYFSLQFRTYFEARLPGCWRGSEELRYVSREQKMERTSRKLIRYTRSLTESFRLNTIYNASYLFITSYTTRFDLSRLNLNSSAVAPIFSCHDLPRLKLISAFHRFT